MMHHGPERRRVTPAPTQLRHVVEVHAVDAGDHRRYRDERRVGGQALGDLVLVDGDERQVDGHHRGRHLAQVLDRLLQADQVVVDVAEVVVQPGADGRHTAAVELAGHLEQRAGGAVEQHQLALEAVERLDLGPRVLAAEDALLDVLGLLGEVLEHREVAIDHRVHQRVEHVGGPVPQQLRLLLAAAAHVGEAHARRCAGPRRCSRGRRRWRLRPG